jgi:hypothetical protein
LHPYEPLLWVFRSGGTFSNEHRYYFDINFSGESAAFYSPLIQERDLTKPFLLPSEFQPSIKEDPT